MRAIVSPRFCWSVFRDWGTLIFGDDCTRERFHSRISDQQSQGHVLRKRGSCWRQELTLMAQRKADKTVERTTSENSFANVAALWLKHWSVGKSSRHVLQVTRRMDADILPRLGTRPIAEIKAPAVVEMVKAI